MMKKKFKIIRRGKFCKNGSHFRHDGGIHYGPDEPDPGVHWQSYTCRDVWGIGKRKNEDLKWTWKQWQLLNEKVSWKWANAEDCIPDDLVRAVFKAKNIK